MNTTAALGLILTAALLLAGCNTMEGLGKDVEAAGEAIEDTADETGNELGD